MSRRLGYKPNIMIEWLTLPLGIWEVLDSNLGPESGYPDCGFCGFSQYLQINAGIIPYKLGH
jgi:hypothetical protein